MKLESEMYVRTKEGYICKILKLNEPFEDDGYLDHNDIKSASIQEKNITKVSHNIIDLIEVGDYVNGVEVEEITDNEIMLVDTHLYIDKSYANDLIETILTKEQFENNCYRVGDEQNE